MVRRKRGKGLGAASASLMAIVVLSGGSAHARCDQARITIQDLQARTQQLWDSVAAGDKIPWTKWIAEDAMVFDETGHDMDKQAVIAGITKLPEGYSGSIKVVDVKVRFVQKTAVLSYNANEIETVYGNVLHARYHVTDTWLFRASRWQIVASQVLRYYEDPEAIEVEPTKLPDYVGRYQLAPGVIFVITLREGRLQGQRGDGKPYPLLAECPDLFFRPGVEGRRLFHRDAKGHIDAMIDRRNNEDLIWKRLE